MKTLQLTLALCALVTVAEAQPITGQNFYGHNGTAALLSSGTHVGFTAANQGFIMGGYLPTTVPGAVNFYVDRVDDDGTFTSTQSFSREYYMFDGGTSCTAAWNQETDCYGVSVIESQSGNINYALAAAFGNGVAFATLNSIGNVVSSAFYVFPGTVTPNGKPHILWGANGDYYVCGSYAFNGIDYMYVFEVQASGAGVWSFVYDLNISTFKCYGMVEDFYNGAAELAIAGTLGTSTTDGYIIKISSGSGALGMQIALASGQTVNESIYSIELANSNSGYILGGSTFMNSGPGRAWMTRLNSNGTFNWTTRIDPSTNNGAGDVIAVGERKSAVYGAFEYYGLTVSAGSNGGMMVLKLDDNGNAFSQPGNTNNEFVYNDGNGNVATPVDMSLLDGGASNNNSGLHVFGIDQVPNSQFFLNQAFFNGATGTCNSTSQQNLTMVNGVQAGPSVTYNFGCNQTAGLPQCQHRLADNQLTYTPFQPCSFNGNPGAPYNGDNSRPAGATSINKNNLNANGISVYPNPANQTAEVNYTLRSAGDVKITLSDMLGRELKTLENSYKAEGVNTVRVDLNAMNLESGVYFINVKSNNVNEQVKVIYNKN